jgi:hypothetical protein
MVEKSSVLDSDLNTLAATSDRSSAPSSELQSYVSTLHLVLRNYALLNMVVEAMCGCDKLIAHVFLNARDLSVNPEYFFNVARKYDKPRVQPQHEYEVYDSRLWEFETVRA